MSRKFRIPFLTNKIVLLVENNRYTVEDANLKIAYCDLSYIDEMHEEALEVLETMTPTSLNSFLKKNSFELVEYKTTVDMIESILQGYVANKLKLGINPYIESFTIKHINK